jgi:carbonic anhydrase
VKHIAFLEDSSLTISEVTCMDARIDPAAAFGISLGDAHVIRNAGGNAVDALRSLVISQQLLGTTEIILVKHTGCGMLIFDTPTATGLVEKNLGTQALKELEQFVGGNGNFQTFPDLEDAVKNDIKLLKDSSLFKKEIVISGWIYEVETGKTRQVV